MSGGLRKLARAAANAALLKLVHLFRHRAIGAAFAMRRDVPAAAWYNSLDKNDARAPAMKTGAHQNGAPSFSSGTSRQTS